MVALSWGTPLNHNCERGSNPGGVGHVWCPSAMITSSSLDDLKAQDNNSQLCQSLSGLTLLLSSMKHTSTFVLEYRDEFIYTDELTKVQDVCISNNKWVSIIKFLVLPGQHNDDAICKCITIIFVALHRKH